ncbi:MAG TPA: LysR family transcriptional regulator [Nitrospiraceae bacterium]|nr:LysR family transcriptional regulator [Nitrospiraceae bacterium]
MDDHKLRVFCTVAETKSFSKASEVIHLTQPAVSLQIQALEEMYGIKLFDRSSSAVTLTRPGEILYKYAKEILSLYSSAAKEISGITGLVKGSVTIGASSTIGNYLLPGVIADFRKKYPKVKVHLFVGNTKRIVELLGSGNIDIGLVEGDVNRQKIIIERLLLDELILIVPPTHPWAKHTGISISELPKEAVIFREEGSGTRQVVEKYLAKYDILPQNLKISLILGSTEAIKGAVEDGMGVSIISRWAAKKESRYGSLKIVTIKEEKFTRDFSLIYNKGDYSSHTLMEFLSFLKSYPFDKLLKN